MKTTSMAGKPWHLQAGLYDLLLIIIICLSVLAIIFGRAPYLHDFAEWLYQGQIVKNAVIDPVSVSKFTLAMYPVPNSLVTALLAGLSLLFPPLWAGKIFLILMILSWAGVIRLFARRFVDVQWRGETTLVLFTSTALATFFWYGFTSYQLALLLLTWFFARYREDTNAFVIAAFAMGIFFSHAMIFLVFGLFLGVRLLLKWNHGVALGLLPATACSLWFLVGRYIAKVEPQTIDANWSGLREALIYKAGYPAMLGPFKNFLLPDGSSLLENQAWIYWPGFIVNFVVVAVFGILVLAVLWNYLKKETSDHAEASLLRSAWAISMLLLIVFYLFAPYHFFGLVNAGGRVLIPLVLMAFMLGEGRTRPFVRAVVWPVVVFALITTGSYFYLMLQTRASDFSPHMTSAVKISASDSVLDFNEQLYAATRYKYFNYRVFAFARRFDQIESGYYHGLTFRHAMLIKFDPEDNIETP